MAALKSGKPHGIVNHLVKGESGEIQEQAIISWMERLREICIGYRLQDIWNMDETGCFFRVLPDKTFSERGTRCKGGKSSKQQVTVAFFLNASGRKNQIQWLSGEAKHHVASSLLG